jgi:hypothetical protein
MVSGGGELGASAREGLDQRSHARVKDEGWVMVVAFGCGMGEAGCSG